MQAIHALVLACALLGAAALLPTAAADITFGIDGNGDRDCNDPGETTRIPTAVGGREIHRHFPCAV